MTPKAVFALCDELLHEVLRFTTPADAVVSSFFRQNRALGARERQTLAEQRRTVVGRLQAQEVAQEMEEAEEACNARIKALEAELRKLEEELNGSAYDDLHFYSVTNLFMTHRARNSYAIIVFE